MSDLPPAVSATAGPVSRPPVAGAGSLPGTPPFGSSPLTMPVPNRGNQVGALALLQGAVRQLEEALPMLAAEPEIGPQLMRVVESLRKIVPEGAVPKGIGDAAQQRFMQQERQQSPILAALQAMGGAGGGGPGAGGPGAGGMSAPGGVPGLGVPGGAGMVPPGGPQLP